MCVRARVRALVSKLTHPPRSTDKGAQRCASLAADEKYLHTSQSAKQITRALAAEHAAGCWDYPFETANSSTTACSKESGWAGGWRSTACHAASCARIARVSGRALSFASVERSAYADIRNRSLLPTSCSAELRVSRILVRDLENTANRSSGSQISRLRTTRPYSTYWGASA